jgi:hypothetical protein
VEMPVNLGSCESTDGSLLLLGSAAHSSPNYANSVEISTENAFCVLIRPTQFAFSQSSATLLDRGFSALVLLSANETHELKTLETKRVGYYFLLDL